MIPNDCIHPQVVRITGGRSEEEVEFAHGLLQRSLGEVLFGEEAYEDCLHFGEVLELEECDFRKVIFTLLGSVQR